MKKLFFLVLLSLSFSLPAQSQTIDLTCPLGKLPSHIDDWGKNPNDISIIIHVASAAIPTAHIVFEVFDAQNNKLASTRDKYAMQPMVNLQVGIMPYRWDQLINKNAVSINGEIKDVISRTGMLPEGNYRICAYAVNSSGRVIESLASGCANFVVQEVEPPMLLSPSDESVVDTNRLLQFSWLPVMGATQPVTYQLRIVPVYKSQSAGSALKSNENIFIQSHISGTSFLYPLNAPSLNSIPNARKFAWEVQCFGDDLQPVGKNGGISKPFIFCDDHCDDPSPPPPCPTCPQTTEKKDEEKIKVDTAGGEIGTTAPCPEGGRRVLSVSKKEVKNVLDPAGEIEIKFLSYEMPRTPESSTMAPASMLKSLIPAFRFPADLKSKQFSRLIKVPLLDCKVTCITYEICVNGSWSGLDWETIIIYSNPHTKDVIAFEPKQGLVGFDEMEKDLNDICNNLSSVQENCDKAGKKNEAAKKQKERDASIKKNNNSNRVTIDDPNITGTTPCENGKKKNMRTETRKFESLGIFAGGERVYTKGADLYAHAYFGKEKERIVTKPWDQIDYEYDAYDINTVTVRKYLVCVDGNWVKECEYSEWSYIQEVDYNRTLGEPNSFHGKLSDLSGKLKENEEEQKKKEAFIAGCTKVEK